MATPITEQEKKRSKEENRAIGTPASSLRSLPKNGEPPLSYAQERLWFLNQLEPDSPVYNEPKALKLKGRLNGEALQLGIDAIVERHEVFRTTIVSADGKPRQLFHDEGKVDLTRVDLSGLPSDQREKKLNRALTDFTHCPFDLQKDWPIRAALIRLGEEEHILLLVTHHIASDGWSSNILFRDLSVLYEAYSQGNPNPLAELPIQYADYSVWQREWLQGKVYEQQLSYWKKQLEGVSSLELPTDHPRPAVQGHAGRTVKFTIPPVVTHGLKDLSRCEGVTLFMTLLAGFQTLLYRYTGQDDIAVGTPTAGRQRLEAEGLIGFFINTLVLRNDLSGNPQFKEFLRQVKENALDAYSHQDLPFEKLVEELHPKRDLSRNPVFQVMFQLRNYPRQALSFGDLTIEEHEFESEIAKFDLSVGLREDEGGLTGSVEYRTDLFEPETIETIIYHLKNLLTSISVDPNKHLSELSLGNSAEKNQLLIEGSLTKGRGFACYIIGASMLAIQCAEKLLANGHSIFGIVSDDKTVENWALTQGIDFLRYDGAIESLSAFLKQHQFDYLFSIFNPYLLPVDILAFPRRLAINYHNGPLPLYAGMHVTSWAIINREQTHGITWHVMAERTDVGDILEQRIFEISADETAISLNTRCHQVALEAFATLIENLAVDQITRTVQDLSSRTYFPRARRPAACFTLDWRRSAEEIDAQIRALNFGDYFNPLGLPKICISEQTVAVRNIKMTGVTSTSPPGTIINIGPETMTVATGSYDLVITELQTLTGHRLALQELATKVGLKAGGQLVGLRPELAKQLSRYNAVMSRHESFWAGKLINLQPLSLPFTPLNNFISSSQERTFIPVSRPNHLSNWLADRNWDSETFMIATFVAFLCRVKQETRFDLGFSSHELQQAFAEKSFYDFFAPFVPLSIDIDEGKTLFNLMLQIELKRSIIDRHETFPRDIIARNRELHSKWLSRDELTWPVALMTTNNGELDLVAHPALHDSDFTFVVPVKESALRTPHWVYNAQRFDCDTMNRFHRQFIAFLNKVMEMPDVSIADIPLLTFEEEQQLLRAWTSAACSIDQGNGIHNRFEAQAKNTPDAIAVQCEGKCLSYDQLNRQANQLAHYLQRLGVGSEVLVAICAERSIETIVGLLAVLKAGGAYVPLDPSYPEEKIDFLIGDSRASILLTQTKILHRFVNYDGEIICIDDQQSDVRTQPDVNPFSNTIASNLAYLIYTSGSTGRPKGVMVEHGALVNFTEMVATLYGITPVDRVLQFASITFDTSAEEIFTTLTRGATLILRPEAMLESSKNFWRHCGELELTVLDLPTAYWHQLAMDLHGADSTLPNLLRLVIIGGEKARFELLKIWLENTPKTMRLLNSYGATEAAVVSSVYDTEENKIAEDALIGRAIGNVQTYVLDKHWHPVPIGIPGELYISGAGLARGYLNQPDLTAEKFIPNPFGCDPGMRLYRTGDVARYLPDGNIQFVGRIDNQVKIRGFRIELGEIEAVLEQHPSIKESVVVAREESFHACRLIAYLVSDPNSPLSTNTLRKFVQQKLPEYMVPSAFVMLNSLPLTINGKVDRNALPIPDASRPVLEEKFVAPRTVTEEMLAEIWAEALKIDTIGVYDNFFDLGGHSLLVTQVVSHIRNSFHIEMALRTLFEHPTVADLSKQITETKATMGVKDEMIDLLSELESISDEDAERLVNEHQDEGPKH